VGQSVQDYLRVEVSRLLSEAHSFTAKAEKESRSLAQEERERVEILLKAVEEKRKQIIDIEDNEKLQKTIEDMNGSLNREREVAKPQAKSLGDAFVKSDAYRALKESGPKSQSWTTGAIEIPWDGKATMTTTASPVIQPDAQPGVLQKLFQPLRIADLLASGTTDSNVVRYIEETTATNAAASVAEGAAKPESTLILSQVDEPVRKVATFLPVTDEMLEDVSQLRSYIDGRLRLFVEQREESLIYGGDGIAPNLSGLITRSGVQTQAKGADSAHDAIYKAMTKVRNVFLEPDGIVINPADWEEIRLAKDSSGQYYGGGPFTGAYGNNGIAPNNLWGLPVVVTTAATAGTALVGAFRTGAQVFRRNTLTVEASNSHADFFQKNLTAIRAEVRLALAVFRPSAFCTVTGV